MTPRLLRRCSNSTGRWVVFRAWTLALLVVAGVAGHGRLSEPPSRSSMWRLGYNTSVNTDDNELSCGGFTNQWIHFGGRCGICGDPYQQRPRDNERGGKYASGLITRTYPIGGTINVVVDLTANHLGYFEFRICPLNDVTGAEPEKCPDRNRLPITNGEGDGYRYYIRDPTVDGQVTLQVQLPKNVYCKHCIFQWKYHTGTRWGCDRELRCDKGIGPQEEFYGCSDISIDNVSSTIYRDPSFFASENNQHNSVAQPGEFASSPMTTEYLNKPDGGKVNKIPVTVPSIPDKKPAGDKFTSYLHKIIMDALLKHYDSDVSFSGFHCKAAPAFAANPIVNEWCYQTCPRNKEMCKPSMCTCKTQIHTLPTLGLRKPLVVLKGGSKAKAVKKLGLDKDEFASFVGRALETYRKAEIPKSKPLKASAVDQLRPKGTHTKDTNRIIRKLPSRRTIVFLKVQDKKALPRQKPLSYKKSVPRKKVIQKKSPLTFSKSVPSKTVVLKQPPRTYNSIHRKTPKLQSKPPRAHSKPVVRKAAISKQTPRTYSKSVPSPRQTAIPKPFPRFYNKPVPTIIKTAIPKQSPRIYSKPVPKQTAIPKQTPRIYSKPVPKQTAIHKQTPRIYSRTIPRKASQPKQTLHTYIQSVPRPRKTAVPRMTNSIVNHSVRTKTDIPKYKDNRNLSNDIYGLQKTIEPFSSERRTIRCVASVDFSQNKYMNTWCVRNCSFGFCPKSVCTCI